MKSSVMDIVSQHFRPEFINRVDDVVVFHPLGREHIRKIVGHTARLPARQARRAGNDDRSVGCRQGQACRCRFRPGLWCASAEESDTAAGRESAGPGDPAGQVRARGTRSKSAWRRITWSSRNAA